VTLVPAGRGEDGSICECTGGAREHLWAWKVPQPDGTVQYVELRGDVRLHDVNFSYVEGKPVLKDVSVYAKPGQKIAFVGSTGAGKTTITNLINRFYEIGSGSITYDGIDLRTSKRIPSGAPWAWAAGHPSVHRTVMDNIRYGRLDATDKECVAAAKSANAHSFIRRLPQGYRTMVTGDGANLSQGQRQLLAIARAAVADPPVISWTRPPPPSIPAPSGSSKRDGRPHGKPYGFVIAHRLSTVRNANAIIVIEGGEIIERATTKTFWPRRAATTGSTPVSSNLIN
jgi:ATP-binding cassette subfamily B protein